MPRPLIAGNWKMNGLRQDGQALASDLAQRYRSLTRPGFDMALCPPFPLLESVGRMVVGSGIALGAQDCHTAEKGAHTGDVSPALLADMGCNYVIVGHSERRNDHGEGDALIKGKAEAALGHGLTPIVCVGESQEQRDNGETLAVLSRQVAGVLPSNARADGLVIAYEPVWAIGTGRTAKAEDVSEAHSHIRAELRSRMDDAGAVRLLYGGSVKPANAGELLGLADVDGALVGGASLKAEDFWGIADAVG